MSGKIPIEPVFVALTNHQRPTTLVALLAARLGLRRRETTHLAAKGLVRRVTGETLAADAAIDHGESVTVGLPPERPADELAEVATPPHIVWEDAWLLVAVKPPRLATHPSADRAADTLAHRIATHLRQQHDPGGIHFVNRLDRPVSGLVLVAKYGVIHRWFQHQRQRGRVHHLYCCVTEHRPATRTGAIDLPLARATGSCLRRIAAADGSGQPARTRFRLFCRQPATDRTLVALQPLTGRTHQLRAHLAAIGCPLVGDFLYGREDACFQRTALHCTTLTFTHPATGRRLRFRTDVPRCMTARLSPPS